MSNRFAVRSSLSPEAERDIEEILEWSERHYGVGAASRYAELIGQALHDLEVAPDRLGTKSLPEFSPGLRTYHLAMSRTRVTGARVKKPRHFILYSFDPCKIQVVRILHDSRDLARHIPLSLTEED